MSKNGNGDRIVRGTLSDCQADPKRLTAEHIKELFNSIPEEELNRRISSLPNGQLRIALRKVARSIVTV